MSFNFPDSPSEGTIFTDAASGAQYIYKSGVWMQSSATQIRLSALPRNRIVNPAMQIAQEVAHGTASGVSNTYIADQWVAYFVTAGVPSFAVNSTYRPDDPDSEWWLRLSNSSPDTSIAAGDYYSVRQTIEGIRISDFKWGTANAKPAVLRFKAYSGIAGTFCVAIRNFAGTKAFVKNCTIAANVGTTFTVPIPPITSGVWPTDNSAGAHLNFTVMAGTTLAAGVDGAWNDSNGIAAPGISNWMSAASQPLDISAVGLYLDPDATGVAPKWEMPDEAEELAACQRYWQRLNMDSGGYMAGVGQIILDRIVFPVVMRTTPAVAAVNDGSVSGTSAANFDNPSAQGCRVILTSSTTGNIYASGRTGTANARM